MSVDPASGPPSGLLPPATARRVALFAAIAMPLILAAVVFFRIDISAARDFRADAVVRDAFPPGALPPFRFFDQSPFTIWLASDWFVWDSIRAGHLPLWDRLQGGGHSPVIGLYGGVFHPVRWIAVAFPRELMPTILMVLALLAAGIGWYLFGRSSGSGALASAVGALLYAFSPAVISHAFFSGSVLPLAHLPWILLAHRNAVRTRTRKSAAVLALVVASLLLAGHPLIELAVCAAAGTFVAAQAIAMRSLRPVGIFAVACGVATLLAAFSIFPSVVSAPELWSYKTSSVQGLGYQPLSLPAWQDALIEMLVDTHRTSCCIDAAPFFGYVGVFAIALVLLSVMAVRSDRSVLPILLLCCFWFVIVVPGPWMAPLRALRPFSYLKPWYYSGALGFAIAAAASAGFGFLWGKGGIARPVAGAIALAAIGLYVGRAITAFQPRRWSPIVAGAVVERLRDGQRVTGLWGQVNLPNTARVTGIEDLRFSGPMLFERYRLWWLLVDPDVEGKAYPTTRLTDHLTSPLVADFNVKYVLQDRYPPIGTSWTRFNGARDSALSPLIQQPRFHLLGKAPSIEVRVQASPIRPRAHFAEEVLRVRDLPAAFDTLRRDPSLPSRASVVESEAPLGPLPRHASGRVTLRYPSDSRAQIDTESATGGLVVLHDTFASGWTATVDAQPATVYAVNVLSRGVVVPAGRHRIEMSYCPPGLQAGFAMSLVSLIGLLALSAIPRQKEERHRRAETETGD